MTKVLVHKLEDLFSGRVTRHNWPARVSWLVDLWKEVEPDRLGYEGNQVFSNVLVNEVMLPHLLHKCVDVSSNMGGGVAQLLCFSNIVTVAPDELVELPNFLPNL